MRGGPRLQRPPSAGINGTAVESLFSCVRRSGRDYRGPASVMHQRKKKTEARVQFERPAARTYVYA